MNNPVPCLALPLPLPLPTTLFYLPTRLPQTTYPFTLASFMLSGYCSIN